MEPSLCLQTNICGQTVNQSLNGEAFLNFEVFVSLRGKYGA